MNQIRGVTENLATELLQKLGQTTIQSVLPIATIVYFYTIFAK